MSEIIDCRNAISTISNNVATPYVLPIRKDFTENGHSTILDRIISEKKRGNCRCETTHPQGR